VSVTGGSVGVGVDGSYGADVSVTGGIAQAVSSGSQPQRLWHATSRSEANMTKSPRVRRARILHLA
jgi:hypothetical protein